jgi:YVTN family beta-propeller protein
MIDAITHLTQTIGVGGSPVAIAVGDGVVWVLDFHLALTPINPQTGTVGTPVQIPVNYTPSANSGFSPGTAVAIGDGAIWVAHAYSIERIDPIARRESRSIDIPSHTVSIPSVAVGEGAVWATNSGGLLRIAEGSVKVTQVNGLVLAGDSAYDPVAVGDGSVWVASPYTPLLYRVDPATSQVVARIPIALGATGIAVGRSRIWVSFSGGTVSAVDPGGDKVASTIPVGGSPPAIAVGPDGSPWIAVQVRP